MNLHGTWTITAREYVREVRRYQQEIGNLRFAATQDWMCEPFVLAKTGLTVEQHQQRTIDNAKALLDAAPTLPWAPVIQGWTWGDYVKDTKARPHAFGMWK